MSGQGPLCSLGSECVKRRQLLGDGAWQLETHLEHPGCCPPPPPPESQNPGLASRKPGGLAGLVVPSPRHCFVAETVQGQSTS